MTLPTTPTMLYYFPAPGEYPAHVVKSFLQADAADYDARGESIPEHVLLALRNLECGAKV